MAKIRRIHVIIEEMETEDDGFETYDSEVIEEPGEEDERGNLRGRKVRTETVRVARPQKLVALARAEARKADSAFRKVSEEITIETVMTVNGAERINSTTTKVL